MRPINIIYCFVTALLLLTGCATTAPKSADRAPSTQHMHANALYTAGKEAINNGNPQGSIHHFNTLITQYPINELTLQGRLELAYAYHKSGQTSATIATTERFIKKYPQHTNIDYAYYLRGLAAYEAAIARLGTDITTDTAITGAPYEAHMALEFLHELINHFPNGKFSGDTRRRIHNINERVARYLVIAAQQQLDQGNLAQAGLLAQAVVEKYPESASLRKAAVITNQAYRLLELSSDNPLNITVGQIKNTLKSDAQPPPPITPQRVSHVTSATTEMVETTTAAAIISTAQNGTENIPLKITPAKAIATVSMSKEPQKMIATPDILNITKKLINHRNTLWHNHSSTYHLYLGGQLNTIYSQKKALLTISTNKNDSGLICEYSTRHGGRANVEADKVTACNTLANKLQTYLEEN
ncbi:MAG: outer membrane protein assembly factor BamD [Gammaproteobacteria bacterium]|nr:outer membrane protein assembly factor BamD [Gammaproteobacteria bacterium]